MTKKDRIFQSFLQHELLAEEKNKPKSVEAGKKSNNPIIKTLALIVNELEGNEPITDQALEKKVITFLNNEVV